MHYTRFCPTLNDKMHAGHAICAAFNYWFGDPRGVLLRFEDVTARKTTTVTDSAIQDNARDFIENCRRLEIPVKAVVWQSSREDIYERINTEQFGGRLTWEVNNWPQHTWHYGRQPTGWAGSSPWMAQLTRVIDDKEFGITQIIRGTELAAEREGYWFIWDWLYSRLPEIEKPAMVFMPEVMETRDRKISKSVSRSYFLSDMTDIPPVTLLARLMQHQLYLPAGCDMNEVVRAGNMSTLRAIALSSRFVMEPEPVSLEEIDSWREKHV